MLRCLDKDPKTAPKGHRRHPDRDRRYRRCAAGISAEQTDRGSAAEEGHEVVAVGCARRACRRRRRVGGAPAVRSWKRRWLRAHFSRFTDWEGTELAGEISPDGKFVAFMSDAAGEFDIWLKQVGTGRFRNLTETSVP